MATPERERGLEARYRVEKISDPTGKHSDCRYFVLDPQHDPIARTALGLYAHVAAIRGWDGPRRRPTPVAGPPPGGVR